MIYETPISTVHALARVLGTTSLQPRRFKVPVLRQPSSEQKLLSVTGQAHDILFDATTVFPFDLFPDSVTIDREKLTITQRMFFFTAKVISVPVRDILSVETAYGPFFGSVHMNSRYFSSNPYSINFLLRRDAIKLQRLLQGYIIAFEREIDCSEIDKPELVYLLNALGEGT